jgi:hypothetical protein
MDVTSTKENLGRKCVTEVTHNGIIAKHNNYFFNSQRDKIKYGFVIVLTCLTLKYF